MNICAELQQHRGRSHVVSARGFVKERPPRLLTIIPFSQRPDSHVPMSQHRLFVGRGQALQELPDLQVATDGIGEEVEDLACQGINGVHDAQLCSSQFNYFTFRGEGRQPSKTNM